jgi:hypothetical protein
MGLEVERSAVRGDNRGLSARRGKGICVGHALRLLASPLLQAHARAADWPSARSGL